MTIAGPLTSTPYATLCAAGSPATPCAASWSKSALTAAWPGVEPVLTTIDLALATTKPDYGPTTRRPPQPTRQSLITLDAHRAIKDTAPSATMARCAEAWPQG